MSALAMVQTELAAAATKEWLVGGGAVTVAVASAAARERARAIGSIIWAATDPTDLCDILDAGANDASDDGPPAVARTVVGALYRGSFPQLPDAPAFVRAVLSKTIENVLPDLFEGLRLGAVTSGLVRRAKSQDPAGAAAAVASWEGLDLHAVPVPLLSAMLAHARGSMCLAALVDLAVSDVRPVAAWLAQRVVAGWVTGMRSELRLMAMIHGDADVPDDLLPADQRLNRDRVLQEHNDGEAAFQAFIEGSAAIHG